MKVALAVLYEVSYILVGYGICVLAWGTIGNNIDLIIAFEQCLMCSLSI